MKSIALALAFILAPAAQAQVASGSRDAVCYSWLSQTPGGVWKLLRPDVEAYWAQVGLPAGQPPRAVRCIRGVIQALIPAVRNTCIVNGDPTVLISAATAEAIFTCTEQSSAPPVTLFTESEPES